jgi:predicted ATP-dependent endonuclease of OLD family
MGAPAAMPLVQGRGVVLVDEVDLHLHPAWQRHVMPTLSRALPNLQFVFTSHSPLVVGSLYAVNVRVLDAMEVGSAVETVVSTSRAEVYGLSADQILTGGHFGLRTTRVESFDRKLQQVASKARSGDADAALH